MSFFRPAGRKNDIHEEVKYHRFCVSPMVLRLGVYLMAILLRSRQQIAKMREAGRLVAETFELLRVAEEAMWRGIRAAQDSKRLGDVGAAIQTYVEENGCSIVREWTGHGVGEKLHEDPSVPHFGKPGSGILLRPGFIFTVEPMVNAGSYEAVLDKQDGWTVRTADGSLSAQFEHSIVITDNGPEILTLP